MRVFAWQNGQPGSVYTTKVADLFDLTVSERSERSWSVELPGLKDDWQIGAIVWLGAFASAALFEDPRRPAVRAVIAGGAAGFAPFLLYYSWNGALRDWFEQVIVASFSRGTTSLQAQDAPERIGKIAELVGLACPQQQWLFVGSLLGLVVIARWFFWDRDRERRRLLLPLCIYHGGILAFSLLDFQRYGDFFVLLHSIAFLLGVLWLALFETGTSLLISSGPVGSRGARGLGDPAHPPELAGSPDGNARWPIPEEL